MSKREARVHVFGAITDTTSEAAMKHAKMYYEEVRHFTTDVGKIASNTGFTYEQILMVKHYLFIDKHVLEKGKPPRCFDECFEIAESWRRLFGKKKEIKEHDVLLIKHELKEMELIAQGLSQEEAHRETNKLYNYTEASDAYYYSIGMGVQDNSIISGAIRRVLDKNTH